MNWAKDDATDKRMRAAHERAAARFGLVCTGPAAWGYLGRTIGRRATDSWLRVASVPVDRATRPPGEGIVGAAQLVPETVPRARLVSVWDWTEPGHAYQADVTQYVSAAVIAPVRPDLDRNPDLTDQWWADLRAALADLATVDAPNIRIRDTWIDKAFPVFLGIPAPGRIERQTGHADLHWGNLTSDPLTLLDWERWGRVPIGYDPGTLHAFSLRVPEVAERIRTEFSHVLDTPAGRIGELVALAEMLQAVARGWYSALAPQLADRAYELTGVRPPEPESAELTP